MEVKVIASAGSALNVYGYPGVFGVPLNCTASHTAPLVWAGIACEPLDTAAVPGSVGLVARGNCSFSDKAWHLQRAGYGAMVLADTTDDCTFMFANRSSTIGLTISATSITHQAGEALKQLLEGEEATASLRQPPVGRVDWSSWALWLLATGCVLTAAWWAGRDQLASQYGGTASHKGQEKQQPQQEEGLHITSAGAVGFVVLSSAMLLLLFFFLSKWVALLLVILFAIGAWQSTTSLVSTWLASTCPPTWHAVYVPLPGIGATPALTLAAATLSGAVTLTWVLCRHAVWSWVLQDFLAICLMLLIMRQLLLPNLKVCRRSRGVGAAGRARCGCWPRQARLSVVPLLLARQVVWMWLRATSIAWLVTSGGACTHKVIPGPVPSPMQVACILLPLAFVYDVWWVFLQPAVTGSESVMVEVRSGHAGAAFPGCGCCTIGGVHCSVE